MERTEKILMELLRCGLCPEATIDPGIFAGANAFVWETVLELSARQGIIAITYDALQQLPQNLRPPKALLLRWAVNTDRIEQDFAHKQRALEQLTAFYTENGIRVMVLKGWGLASWYPVPAHRPCGDIDLWLYGRQPEADRLVREKLGIPVSNDVHHHTIFTFKGVMIENHFNFLNTWSHRSNRALERDLRRYADEPGRTVPLGEQTIGLPAPELNALFLMRHMAMHFAAVDIGLRHLSDWAVFLRTEGRQVDWPTVRAICKAQNMHRFADAATAICVEWLGVEGDIYPYENDLELQTVILAETLCPAFNKQHPSGGVLRAPLFKLKRWWVNRWKHRIVYRDSLASSFLWLCWAHLIRPKSIIH